MLPTTQEYKIALMIGEDSFRTLQNLEVIPHPTYPNEPWYSTGGLSIVFKIKLKDKYYALKCFYAEANERQERLEHIATYLKQNPSPYFVDFTYLDNELWVETAQGGNGYPVILMEWVEGKTLDNYLAEVCKIQGTARLQNLYFQFCNLAWWLQQQPIAHGDLKHDNIIVTTEGKLKLIDYDGMFVPALQGRKANEQGSPCYQHPQRDAYYFNEHLDDFSILILQITLLALKQDPSLFKAHYNGDGILLKDTDYPNFAKSSIKAHLWRLDDVKIPLLLSQLQSTLNKLGSIDLIPLLQDVEWINWLVGGQKGSNLVIERRKLSTKILEETFWSMGDICKVASIDMPVLLKLAKRLEGNGKEPLITFLIPYDIENNEIKRLWIGIPEGMFVEAKKNEFADLRLTQYKAKHFLALPQLNELYIISIKRERFKELFFSDKKWEALAIKEIEQYHPLNENLLEKHKDRWDWNTLSSNTNLPWTVLLIERYKNKWNYRQLSYNTGLPWTVDLIEKYKNRWLWDTLTVNKGLPWTVDLIEKYEDKWVWDLLGRNRYISWTIDMIEMYNYRWKWEGLSLNPSLAWTIDLIKKYEDKWVWENLSQNTSLPWTIDLIKKYEDKWVWKQLARNNALPWTMELIEKYNDNWDWDRKWTWGDLSSNTDLPWTTDLIEKHKRDLDWEQLSSNNGLPWTIDLILLYENRWNWSSLSSNTSLPWTMDLIRTYKVRWDWDNLSGNTNLPWTITLIKEYEDKWDWKKLSFNKGIYENLINPLLDDTFIDEIMSTLTQGF